MINKSELIKFIEKEFQIKLEFADILFYTSFEWHNDSALEEIVISVPEMNIRLSNDKMIEYEDFIVLESYGEIYLLSKNNERKY
jgi:hypothetical protein